MYDQHMEIFHIQNLQIKLLPLRRDIDRGPSGKKIREILDARQQLPEKDMRDIIADVAEANRCHTFEHKIKGRRKLLWGLYEADPEETVTYIVRGHFCQQESTNNEE